MSDNNLMNRRELIQRVAMLMGGAISAPAVLGVLNGCSPKPNGASWTPQFLSKEEGAVVDDVAELIIPRTDTPGALDVKVPEFIDLMLTEWATDEEREKFLTGLDQIDTRSIAYAASQPDASAATPPQRFGELTGAQKAGLVNEFDTVRGDNSAIGVTFGRLKALTVYGYFTSKVVQEQILKEPMFFEGYKGNVPFTPAV